MSKKKNCLMKSAPGIELRSIKEYNNQMRIDDMNKAWEMAHAENQGKSRARDPKLGPPSPPEELAYLDRAAEKDGEKAGERYEERKANEEQEKTSESETKTPLVDLEHLKTDALTEGIRRLSRILREREEDRVDPLTESNIKPALLKACEDLEFSKKEKSIDKVTESLSQIAHTIEKIGQVSGRGRDSSENLRKVIKVMEEIKGSAFDMKSPDRGEELNNVLNKISGLCDKKMELFMAKRRVLQRYEERRY